MMTNRERSAPGQKPGAANNMKNTMKLAAITLLLTGTSMAQTVEEVAAENDAQQLDIVTIDSKASQAKARADETATKQLGLEQRVTIAEGSLIGKADSTAISAIESRVLTLEQQPQTDPTIATRLTSAEARITSLESAPAPTVLRWVARDSLGSFVASWYDRAAVGLAFIDVLGVEIRAVINPDAISWSGIVPSGGAKYYGNTACSGEPYAKQQGSAGGYIPADLSSGDWFAGIIEGEIVQRADGSAYVVAVDTSTVITSGDLYARDANQTGGATCQWKGRGLSVHPNMYLFDLPVFVPPITIAQEQ